MDLNLGQYWLEVTLAYGIALALLASLIFVSWSASRRTAARLSDLQKSSDES